MIQPHISLEGYNRLSSKEKSLVFQGLAYRILVIHPEYLKEAQELETVDIVYDIKEMIENSNSETNKVQKYIKKIKR